MDKDMNQREKLPALPDPAYVTKNGMGNPLNYYDADDMRDYAIAALQSAAPPAPALGHEIIAGVLFDFMGMLTTSDTKWRFSSADDAVPGVQAIREFAGKRGLSLEEADVKDWRSALSSEQAAPAPQQPISEMVDRFLGWNLPKDFYPDCGITFDGRKDDEWNKNKTWPIGTNLFTADQAKAMFEYCLQPTAAVNIAQPVAPDLRKFLLLIAYEADAEPSEKYGDSIYKDRCVNYAARARELLGSDK